MSKAMTVLISEFQIPATVWQYAKETIKKALVMPLADFEESILKLLASTYTPEELSTPMEVRGKNRNRTRGQNLVDHVKAQLTKKALVLYIELKKVPHLVSNQVCGMFGDEAIVKQRVMHQTLYKLLECSGVDYRTR